VTATPIVLPHILGGADAVATLISTLTQRTIAVNADVARFQKTQESQAR